MLRPLTPVETRPLFGLQRRRIAIVLDTVEMAFAPKGLTIEKTIDPSFWPNPAITPYTNAIRQARRAPKKPYEVV